MSYNINCKSHDFIRSHPELVVSHIKGDTVAIPDPSDNSNKINLPKHLRQISIGELDNDLIKNLLDCTASCGKVLV